MGACHLGLKRGTRGKDTAGFMSSPPPGLSVSASLSHLPHPGAERPLPGAGLLQAKVGIEEDQIDIALQVLQAPQLQPLSLLCLFGGLCLEDKEDKEDGVIGENQCLTQTCSLTA